ncbi:MAG: hypothetical protein RJA81_2455 [Planctomycetota bacterium]
MQNSAKPIRLNLACGSEPKSGWVNLDCRLVPKSTDLVADIERLPFPNQFFDEVAAENVLEHLRDPRIALSEIARITKPAGQLVVRVPALGTNAAHLDPTHVYLADLKHWHEIVSEFFLDVQLGSVGVKWRSSLSLVIVQRLLIRILGWHDFGQCWILTARRPRTSIQVRIYRRWWLDS